MTEADSYKVELAFSFGFEWIDNEDLSNEALLKQFGSSELLICTHEQLVALVDHVAEWARGKALKEMRRL